MQRLSRLGRIAPVLLSVFAPAAFSQEGTLDPTFGAAGIVQVPDCCEFQKVVVQPDEKLIAVGYATTGGDILVARYGINGTPDPTFGIGGVAPTTTLGRGFAAALQADGKVVVVGTNSGSAVVFRLTDVGVLDSGFGTGGVSTASPCASAIPRAVAIQPADSKIVVAGYCGGDVGGFLLRFNANGAPDMGFGVGGTISVTSHPLGTVFAFRGLGLDSLERIVVGGDAGTTGPSDRYFLAMRFLPNGTLDATFGTAGAAFLNVVPNFSESCFGIAVDPLDRVVMAGGYHPPPIAPEHLAVGRLTSTGSPDASFGTGGVVTTTVGSYERAWAVLVQPDGKVVAAGLAATDGNQNTSDFFLVRYLPNGVPDPSFGTSGLVRTDINAAGVMDEALGLVVQGAGRLVVAGSSASKPVLARYSATTPVQLMRFDVE